MEYKNKSKYNFAFVIVLITVVLCSCFIISITISWLTRLYNFENNTNQIGSIDIRLYANGTEVTGTYTTTEDVTTWECNQPYEIVGNTNIRDNINLTMRNLGTIDALVRATINIYYLEGTNKRTVLLSSGTPTNKGDISLDNAGWINDFPSPTVACGYVFYNSKVQPYYNKTLNGENIVSTPVLDNEISIINQILVSDLDKNVTFYVDVTLDAIAYDGNIYKKIENNQTSPTDIPVYALPFGTKESLPELWTAWR